MLPTNRWANKVQLNKLTRLIRQEITSEQTKPTSAINKTARKGVGVVTSFVCWISWLCKSILFFSNVFSNCKCFCWRTSQAQNSPTGGAVLKWFKALQFGVKKCHSEGHRFASRPKQTLNIDMKSTVSRVHNRNLRSKPLYRQWNGHWLLPLNNFLSLDRFIPFWW